MTETRKTDVAIIGAGSAGLYAIPQIRHAKRSFIMMDGGELGTTCARVGCMPSKALIQVADDFHRTGQFAKQGLQGGEQVKADIPQVLSHVRRIRDRLSGGVRKRTQHPKGGEFIHHNAYFIAPDKLKVGDEIVEADKIIIATGSSPVVPKPWQAFGDRILTTDSLFEQQDLPKRIAVIGLGVIGLEMGQALSRLGLQVHGFDQLEHIGGITDPEIDDFSFAVFNRDLPMTLGHAAEITEQDGCLLVSAGETNFEADAILVAIGRKPNLKSLQLENAGITLNENGLPDFDSETLQIKGHPVFIAGDVNAQRPLLHEAGDDGRICGFNACQTTSVQFKRKLPLAIVYTDPQIAHIGARYDQLDEDQLIVGETDFESQGRAIVMGRDEGLIQLYFDQKGLLLGASLLAPGAEHLAHYLALAISQNMGAAQLMKQPYYHPCLEEALHNAVADAYHQLGQSSETPIELNQ
ncbi:MAG: dihydrolipoyl dehydrogenase [bacterium]